MLALEGGHGLMKCPQETQMKCNPAGMIWLNPLNTFLPRGRFDLDKEPLL